MNMKRIICLILAAVTVLGILASGIMVLVSAAAPSTDPSQSTEPTQPADGGNSLQEMKNGDKIVVFILGAIVPAVIFLVMIVKTVWNKK